MIVATEVEEVKSEVQNADAIVLLYDLTSEKARSRVKEFWLPEIASIDNNIPILIVGTKQDLINEESDQKDYIEEIVKEFPQVSLSIDLSTKYHENLADLLYCIQRAIKYPINPLFNYMTQQLRAEYKNALERVFRMCDINHDRYLDNEELKKVQEDAFTTGLSNDDIDFIKDLLISEVFFT